MYYSSIGGNSTLKNIREGGAVETVVVRKGGGRIVVDTARQVLGEVQNGVHLHIGRDEDLSHCRDGGTIRTHALALVKNGLRMGGNHVDPTVILLRRCTILEAPRNIMVRRNDYGRQFFSEIGDRDAERE